MINIWQTRFAVMAFILAGCGRIATTAQAAWPHHEEIAPGIHVVGFADKYRSANCGWIGTADGTLLIDLPRGENTATLLADIAKSTGKPVTTLVLTSATAADLPVIDALLKQGVKRVCLSPATFRALMSRPGQTATNTKVISPAPTPRPGYELLDQPAALGDAQTPIEFLPQDQVFVHGGACVRLPKQQVLFGGPLLYHGPRVPLAGSDTAAWVTALEQLSELHAAHVVPGFGSWGDGELVPRQLRFLSELRRQVAYFIAQGQPQEDLQRVVRLVPHYLVWMPYDTPLAEDLDYVYRELTVPLAPFNGHPPEPGDKRPHALVLIGDQPHEPGHIEAGLRPVFAATDVVPHFAFDVRALSADNLARVQLLVILRDGLQRPQAPGQPDYVWMTPTQEKAVVDFVHRGGGFLNLHNSMGLYPEDGPYLRLVGGRYIGHGPLERFRVEVVDRDHPVTRGVQDFSVADEQHTPPIDADKVHLLLRNRSDDGQTAAAGWVYEPGQGRLCHLANGHTRESLAHPMYRRLMRNAVLWCLRQDAGATAESSAHGIK
ncbi:MAG TPA: ThuA domain-containing protein [Pirellulales bacterium]